MEEVYKVTRLSRGKMQSAMVCDTPLALTFELGKKTECAERHFSVFSNKKSAIDFMCRNLYSPDDDDFRLLKGTTSQTFSPEETTTVFVHPSEIREYFIIGKDWKHYPNIFEWACEFIKQYDYNFELPCDTRFVNDFVPEEIVR